MINATKKGESKPIYPTMRIDLTHLPEAKKWELGKTYEVEFGLRLVGLSQSRYDNSAEFEIVEIGPEASEEDDEEGEEK